MTKKVSSMAEQYAKLNRQMKILNSGLPKKKKVEEKLDEEMEEDDEIEVHSAEEDDEVDSEEETEEDDSEEETEEDDSEEETEEDDSEEETEDDSEEETEEDDSEEETEEDDSEEETEEDDSEETEEDDTEEAGEETENSDVASVNEKLDKLISDFNKFRGKTISMLEAILAANRITLGLKESETPRLVKEKKKLGILNTASGKLKKEVEAFILNVGSDGLLHVTDKHKTISKATACEEELEIRGKIPNGNWIVAERKEHYYLISVENFDEADDVTPYSDDEEETPQVKQGQVVNKKGSVHNVRGYELVNREEDFKLTKRNLENPVKVFNAKWTKQDCDYPIVGEPIPEGHWVIVYDSDNEKWYIVSSDSVEAKVSTKRTEKKPVKKAVKKVAKKTEKKVAKKPVKKVAKKVAKKNKK